MQEQIITSPRDLNKIPYEFFPLAVFSHKVTSPTASLIAQHEKGVYSHFMWLISRKFFASQDWLYHQVSVDEYLDDQHFLKFIYIADSRIRVRIMNLIMKELDKPWYRRMYDVVAIIGQGLELHWLQLPGFDICSDKAAFLGKFDPRYNLDCPSPIAVNNWMKNTPGYEVYGRYRPD